MRKKWVKVVQNIKLKISGFKTNLQLNTKVFTLNSLTYRFQNMFYCLTRIIAIANQCPHSMHVIGVVRMYSWSELNRRFEYHFHKKKKL